MFNTIKFRLGVHATIPLYMDVVKAMSIGDLEHIEMVISASQLTPVQIAIAALCDEIGLILASQSVIDPDKSISMTEFRNNLVLTSKNSLAYQMHITEDVVEQIGMILHAYQTDPDLTINMAKDSVIRNNLKIAVSDDVEVYPTIHITEVDNDMVIGVGEGIEIGPIRKTLGEIDNMIELNLSKRIARIRNWDETLLSESDEWKVGAMVDVPLDLALAVSVLEDEESGKLNLVIQACDNVGTIITHPVLIGTIDPSKIGDLDPYKVPDAISE